MKTPGGSIRVALAGNPNAGKTSIFNALTGSRQHVGNYSGVTVERRTGYYTKDGARVEVLDLPGPPKGKSRRPEKNCAASRAIAC